MQYRNAHKWFTELRRDIATCYEYSRTEAETPEECVNCTSDIDCPECETYDPPFIEKITVDAGRLIGVTKQYALYGKDVDTDIDAIMMFVN